MPKSMFGESQIGSVLKEADNDILVAGLVLPRVYDTSLRGPFKDAEASNNKMAVKM